MEWFKGRNRENCSVGGVSENLSHIPEHKTSLVFVNLDLRWACEWVYEIHHCFSKQDEISKVQCRVGHWEFWNWPQTIKCFHLDQRSSSKENRWGVNINICFLDVTPKTMLSFTDLYLFYRCWSDVKTKVSYIRFRNLNLNSCRLTEPYILDDI